MAADPCTYATGSFLVGLIVPAPIRAPLTEKIEDLVSVLLLPLVSTNETNFECSDDNLIAMSLVFCVVWTQDRPWIAGQWSHLGVRRLRHCRCVHEQILGVWWHGQAQRVQLA